MLSDCDLSATVCSTNLITVGVIDIPTAHFSVCTLMQAIASIVSKCINYKLVYVQVYLKLSCAMKSLCRGCLEYIPAVGFDI